MDRGQLIFTWIAAISMAVAVAFSAVRIPPIFYVTALAAVAGLTIFAIYLRAGRTACLHALRMARAALLPPPDPLAELARQVHSWGRAARRDGLLALARIGDTGDAALTEALAMLARGLEARLVEATLAQRREAVEAEFTRARRAWRGAALLAPLAGLLVSLLLAWELPLRPFNGAVLLPLLYGVLLAQMVCTPLARRIGQRGADLLRRTAALHAAVVAIGMGESADEVERLLAGV